MNKINNTNSPTARRSKPMAAVGAISTLSIALIALLLLVWGTRSSQARMAVCAVPSATYATIQAAVDDTNCTTVQIAAGIYTEAVTITRDLTLRGAGNEQTILDGENNHRPLTIGLSDAEIFNTDLSISQRTYIEDLAVRNGNATTIEPSTPPVNSGRIGGGLLVRNLTAVYLRNVRVYDSVARASGTGSGFGGGVGLYGRSELHASASTRIYRNQASLSSISGFGGGIAALDSTVYLTDTYLYQNMAKDNSGGQGKGGGIYVDDFATDNFSAAPIAFLTVRNSQIYSNTAIVKGGAGYGGGLFAGETTNTRVRLYDNEWRGNVARGSTAGSGDGYGGAIAADVQTTGVATLNIYRDSFIANRANDATVSSNDSAQGGALYLDANTTGLLTGTVENATFMDNVALAGTGSNSPQGGALWSRFASITMSDSTMQANAAAQGTLAGQGGAIRLNGAPLIVTRSSLFDNRAAQGGSLYMRNDDSNRAGYLRIINSVWADSVATQGAQIYHANANTADLSYLYHATLANDGLNSAQALYIESAPITIRNSIVSDHAAGIANAGPPLVTESDNLFFNNTNDTTGTVGPGTNSQTGDPAYVNPTARNYHIASTSAARDQGSDLLAIIDDIDGDTRDNLPDMGADEYVTTPPTATPTATGTATPSPTATTNNTVTPTATPASNETSTPTSTPTVTPTKTPIVIEVRDNQFVPASITINVGDTVIWRRINGFHNVRADDDSFRLGEAGGAPGSTWTEVSHTFTTVGTVLYYCEVHGATGGNGMAGQVIVQAASPTGTPTPTASATGTITPTPTASATATPTATRTPIAIEVRNNSFSPPSVTIEVGDTIIWRRIEGFHNVRADDDLFRLGDENGEVSNSWSEVSYTFFEAGTIAYYCEAHGSPGGTGMAGEVIVQAAATATPTSTPASTVTPTVTPTITGTTTPGSSTPTPTATPTVTPLVTGTPASSLDQRIYLPIVQQGN